MDITLRQLRYFLALYEHRHFGRAAEASNISQPALSVQIRELEAHLGAPLIDRTRRGFAPTPLGRAVAGQACRVLAEVDTLADLARARRGLEGAFALGVIPTIAPFLLPPALAAIRAELPKLELRVREAKTDDLLEDLAEGRLDACVLATDAGDPAFVERDLFEDRFLLAIPAETADEMGLKDGAVTAEQVAALRLLLLDEGHCLRDQALNVCKLVGREARHELGASSLATLLRLVAGGYGATLAPEIARAEAGALPGLRLVRLAAPEPRRLIRLVTRRRAGYDALAGILSRAGAGLTAG